MYISHKSNGLQSVHELDWECRRLVKRINVDEYWPWLDSITTDGVPDYSGETGYTIVECTDEDVQDRLGQLDSYIDYSGIDIVYNIKYYASKRDAEEILDIDGKRHDPKQYVQSLFVGDDTAKDARLLADKWANVRRERNSKLAETDYLALSDQTLSDDWEKYRQDLRDVPTQSDPDDITWPTKP